MTHRLPPTWLEATIDELFRTTGGGTPATGRSEFWGDGVPWITSADIDDAGDISPRKAVTPSGIASSATNPVPLGSVVVVTRVGLGKVGLAKQELCFSQDCQALLFNRDLLVPSFVAHQVRCKLRGIRGRGTTIAGVTVRELGALTFSLAPVPEQQRIVEAIDSYLTRLDDAVASLERVLAKLKAYRASVLKAAIEGRLVPTEASLARAGSRAYEPAEALLARIVKERRRRWEEAELAKMKTTGKTPKDDKWKANYEEPAPTNTRGLPELPQGWSWASLEQVTDVQLGQQRAPVHANAGTHIPYVRAANITWSGLDLNDVKEMGFPNPERYRLLYGDVLLSEASGSPMEAGKPAIWRDEIPGACYQKTLLRIRAIDARSLLPDYLRLVFLRDCVTGKFARLAPGVGIVHLTAERMLVWPIPLPPLPEQQRIVDEADRLESCATNAKSNISSQLAWLKRLRQSLLKWAFEGKLVHQDPTDEPAERLLARIRDDCAAAAPTKKSRSRTAKGAA